MIKNNKPALNKKSTATRVTLEALSKRMDAIEEKLTQRNCVSEHNLSTTNGLPDWWEVVGICKGSKILPLIEAEGKAIREAERVRARKKKK